MHERGLALRIQVTISRSKFLPPGAGARARAGIANPGYDFTFQLLRTGARAETRSGAQGLSRFQSRHGGLWHCRSRLRFHVPSSCHRGAGARARAGIADPGCDFTFQVLATGGQVQRARARAGKFSPPGDDHAPCVGEKNKKEPRFTAALSESLSTLWDSTIQAWHYKLYHVLISPPPDASASAVLSLTAYSPLSLYVPARRPALSAALGGDRAAAQAATTDGTAAGVCGANVRVRVRGPTPEAGCPSSLLASACGRLMCILRAREYSCTIACYVYVRVVGG